MLNHESVEPEQVTLYRGATARAVTVVDAVEPAQWSLPTPCTEWTVQDLVDHLVAGTDYLVAAMEGRAPVATAGTTPVDFRRGVDAVLSGLGTPGALDQVCQSPLGFEWPVSQAVAGTFMDVLIHTWDLARATGQDETLDPALVDACVAMFLPDMPVRGRAAGILGPEVPVGPDASAQARLLGAMGRHP